MVAAAAAWLELVITCSVVSTSPRRAGSGRGMIRLAWTSWEVTQSMPKVAPFAMVDGLLGAGLGAHRDRPCRRGHRELGEGDVTGYVRQVDRGGRRELQLADCGGKVEAGGDQVAGRPAGLVVGGGGDRGVHLTGRSEQRWVGAGGRADQFEPADRGPRPREVARVDDGREPL